MGLEKPSGIYRTNTLARINVCDSIDTPLANAVFQERLIIETFLNAALRTQIYVHGRKEVS